MIGTHIALTLKAQRKMKQVRKEAEDDDKVLLEEEEAQEDAKKRGAAVVVAVVAVGVSPRSLLLRLLRNLGSASAQHRPLHLLPALQRRPSPPVKLLRKQSPGPASWIHGPIQDLIFLRMM